MNNKHIVNLEEIKEAHIYDVVSNYIELSTSGTNYKACCPFHNEKTESFIVSPSKNIATCFGECNRSWNVIDFVIEKEGSTFPEAVKKVADISGKKVEYKDSAKAAVWIKKQKDTKFKEQSLLPLLKHVHEIYKSNTESLEIENKTVEEVEVKFINFMNRFYREETLILFGAGVAEKNTIKSVYKQKALDPTLLKELGLIRDKGNGSYDFFQNRHIVPIYDHLGNIRGFAGRDNDPEGKVKYLNSLESPVYNKKNLLFGLYQNRRAIQKSGQAIVVEGYTDVMSMTEFGFDNTVGTGGTAFTIEQLQLLKRFTDEIVFLPDNDPAGQKTLIRNIELAVKVGFKCFVLIFESKEKAGKKIDPDSFLRENGADAFEKFFDFKENGLIWRVMMDVDPKDEFTKAAAIDVAARLLVHVKKKVNRSIYVGQLCQLSRLGNRKKDLQEAIQIEENKSFKTHQNDSSPDQEKDLKRYGFCIINSGNGARYYKPKGEYKFPLTNFVIDPIYLIASYDNPTRMVQITNIHGHSEIIDAPTDTYVEFSLFKKEIAKHGNFRFEGDARSSDFSQIIAKVYDDMEKAYRVTTLGWHKKGFFTWNNGITIDGKFTPVIDNGLVEFEDIKYILPGKNFNNKNDDSLDDTTAEQEYLKLYRYKECDVKIEDWIKMMYDVYGDNGLVAISFYFAALWRDVIYPRKKSFPILNLFGPKGRGKSTIAWSLSYLFGDARAPINLSNFTRHGLVTRGNQIRNGMLWVDEYKNALEGWVIELLKSLYDGVGRERGKKDNKKGTESISVLCAVILSGQDLPIKDIALFDRCITLHFNYKKTQEGYERYQKLNKLEMSGKLSHFTSSLQQYRGVIEKEFDITFDRVRTELEASLPDPSVAEARIVQNYSIPLAVVSILSSRIKLPEINNKSFYDALLEYMAGLVDTQSRSIQNQDELAEWWKIFTFLTEPSTQSLRLRHYADFIVEERTELKVSVEKTRAKTKDIYFDQIKTVIFIRFNNAYRNYKAKVKSEGGVSLDDGSLLHYLMKHDSFLGKVRAKKFNKSKGSFACLAFDMEKLYLNIPLSIETYTDNDDLPDNECKKCNKPHTKCQCNEDLFSENNKNSPTKEDTI